MELEILKKLVVDALEDLKVRDLCVIDVRSKTTITDLMIIASGTSERHVKALADNVIEKAKSAGIQPIGVEGERGCEWVLVDLGDIVVHVMLPAMLDFYGLEKLGSIEVEPIETQLIS